jgi:hypothetical protein
MPFVILVVIGWLYVALMMALAEATHANGSVLGGIFTFLLYGVGPVALVVYILMTPARKRAIRAREQEQAEQEAARASREPDGGGKTPADPIAPVRKEP